MQAGGALGGRPGLMWLKRGGDRDYMMRSERRRGYGSRGNGGRGPRRRFDLAGLLYRIAALILLVGLFPVGVVLLWRRRMGMSGAAKLLATLTGAFLFFLWVAYLLTMPVEDARLADAQAGARRAFIAAQQAVVDGASSAGQLTADVTGRAVANLRALVDNADVVAQVAAYQARSAAVRGVEALGLAPPAGQPALSPTEQPQPSPSPGASETPGADETPGAGETPGASETPSAQPTSVAAFAQPTPTPAPEVGAQRAAVVGAALGAAMHSIAAAPVTTAPEAAQTAEPDTTATAAPEAGPTSAPDATATSAPEAAQTAVPETAASAAPDAAATAAPQATEAAAPEATPAATPGVTATPTVDPALLPQVKPIGETAVYYFTGSRYYHMAGDCGSMRNAPAHTLLDAVADGKTACPYCHPVPKDLLDAGVVVWVDLGAQRFHITDECEQLSDNRAAMPIDEATGAQYQPCEECGAYRYVHGLPALGTPAPATAAPSGDAIVYVGDKSQYYHQLNACQGLQGLTPTTLDKAIAAGKQPCPACEPLGTP